MPLERDRDAMRDMLDCIRAINARVSDRVQAEVEENPEARDAVLYRLIVLGEAASRVSNECRDDHPEIPWVVAIKTRNFLVHVYDKIKWDIVWQTVHDDLPRLEAQLRGVLNEPD